MSRRMPHILLVPVLGGGVCVGFDANEKVNHFGNRPQNTKANCCPCCKQRSCLTTQPGPSYAYFNVLITLNGRQVPIREFGYMLRNCAGEAVMIRTHRQYLK